MKVTITYQPGEEQEADILKRAAASIMGPVRIWSTEHPPYKHIYVKTLEADKS